MKITALLNRLFNAAGSGAKKPKEPDTMKFLITGLGNMGPDYVGTRHNIGFEIVEALAAEKDAGFEVSRYGDVAKVKHRGKTLILLKPSTFMNLSGKAVRYWMDKENIPLERTLTITDDVALPLGTIRIKKKGSAGGHNGLTDIIARLGRDDFPRLRFGIGNDFPRGAQVDYVLGRWTEEERTIIKPQIKKATESILAFAFMGVDKAMNLYNNK
ncbi:MAG: aminoacyl-tRNA hydrolase [Bacteroidota bacterium]